MWFLICLAMLTGNTDGNSGFVMRAESSAYKLFETYFRKSIANVKLECALLCFQSSYCKDFTFDPRNELCYQYTSTPKHSDTSILLNYSLIYYSTGRKICPPPYTYLASWERCVFTSTETRTFDDALADCESGGGHLIYVPTLADQDLIRSLLNGTEPHHYVGGRNKPPGTKESFYWLNSGQQVEMWATGEPGGGADKCVVISPANSFLHRDLKCNSSRKYICEIFMD